jgi:hypothetical protein
MRQKSVEDEDAAQMGEASSYLKRRRVQVSAQLVRDRQGRGKATTR